MTMSDTRPLTSDRERLVRFFRKHAATGDYSTDYWVTEILADPMLRELAPAIDLIAGEPVVCEQHPWRLWPARDKSCPGPGMPLRAARRLYERPALEPLTMEAAWQVINEWAGDRIRRVGARDAQGMELAKALHAHFGIDRAAVRALVEALQSIVDNPQGAYTRDQEQYLKNVIEWCRDTARAALASVQAVTNDDAPQAADPTLREPKPALEPLGVEVFKGWLRKSFGSGSGGGLITDAQWHSMAADFVARFGTDHAAVLSERARVVAWLRAKLSRGLLALELADELEAMP